MKKLCNTIIDLKQIIHMAKYKIMVDRYREFDCYILRWYWPFWTLINKTSFSRKDDGIEFIKNYKTPVYQISK